MGRINTILICLVAIIGFNGSLLGESVDPTMALKVANTHIYAKQKFWVYRP